MSFGMPGCNRFDIESLEPRQFLSVEHPVAINFNDESLWDGNFNTAVSQAKSLGVTAVRVWIGFDSYDQRPSAWDAVPAYGTAAAGATAGSATSVGNAARTMKDIFALARDGFSVLLVVSPNNGLAPTSPDQVKGFIQHLMDATETPTSTTTLANVVDYWEIGNEPDTAAYWAPSGVNKTAGLQSYVDNFLIPAAETLHGSPTPEKVVSAGVSYNPADLKTILDELAAQNALSDIDYAGFHPYGTFDPTNPAAGNQVLDRTVQAKAYASAYGKSLIATEWNVRGFGNTGANNAQWAAAMDYEYRNVIEPNYSVAYYFALLNNWTARGGTTSARPGGLLIHASPVAVTPSSSIADLTAYYNSPLVSADPFYTTFSQWQMASVSGAVAESAGGLTPSTIVYVDANNNGQLDAGEASTTTAADGTYTLNYSISTVTPGVNPIRIVTPATYTAAIDTVLTDLEPLTALSGVNFSITAPPVVAPPVILPPADPIIAPVIPPVVVIPTLGSIAGQLWLDADADKKLGVAETLLAGWTVYIDLDGSGTLAAADPQAVTDANGNFNIAYDTSSFTATSAALRVSMTTDYAATTVLPTVQLTATAQTGVQIGVYHPPASISGFLWNDGNGDGLVNGADTRTGSRVVYIDANRNGKLDAGEKQTTSDASGNFTFQNLAAGTYYVSRVFPAGFHLSNGTTSYITVTATAGQNATGANIGTTDKAAAVVTPPVVVPPVLIPPVFVPPVIAPPVVTPPVVVPPIVVPPIVVPPVVVPPAAPSLVKIGTASVSGSIFARVGSQTKSLLAAGLTAYIDANNNGICDAGESTAAVNATTGAYAFANLAAGTYTIAMMTASGWNVYTPTSKTFVTTLSAGRVKTGQNFVMQKA